MGPFTLLLLAIGLAFALEISAIGYCARNSYPIGRIFKLSMCLQLLGPLAIFICFAVRNYFDPPQRGMEGFGDELWARQFDFIGDIILAILSTFSLAALAALVRMVMCKRHLIRHAEQDAAANP